MRLQKMAKTVRLCQVPDRVYTTKTFLFINLIAYLCANRYIKG